MIEQDFICDYNCEHYNEENCIKYNTSFYNKKYFLKNI